MRMRLRPYLIATGFVAAILVLPAIASASVRSESATLTMNDQAVTLSPRCAKGQVATGGGWTVPAPFSPSSATRVYESRKIGQRTWRVSALQISAGAVKTFTAFAYCAKGPATTQKSKTISVPDVPGVISGADASCGHAGQARAGGFLTTAAPITDILDSFRSDKKTWRSRVHVSVGSGSRSLTSYAYCADRKKPGTRTGSGSSSTSHDPTQAVSGKCPKGRKAVAGGFSQPDADLTDGWYDFPFESLRAGKRSRQTAAVHYGTASTTLTSIAYCG